ncbi:hypothetical protein FRB94_008951 [Tulasnella sp. JGI-2019a]|nr:hypothetical protein FRB94_008951 [Tulasnella sp. JGI-2019a]KAG9026423.1 hypothetical protein FRB95_008862 [Tulasnella sp. JGI-2019a]
MRFVLQPNEGCDRSRSARIVLLPASLLVLSAAGSTVLVILHFFNAMRPTDPRLPAIKSTLFIAVQSVVIVYTSYITIFIAGRLWYVGRAGNELESSDEVKRNRYFGAISALIQSGAMQMAMRVFTIAATAKGSLMMIGIAGRVAASVNGMSATLLVLARVLSAPPLTTGATIQFANPEGPSSSTENGEWPLEPTARVQRASASMAVYRVRDAGKDIANTPTSGRLRVTYTQQSPAMTVTP